jgi:hypothetical protein
VAITVSNSEEGPVALEGWRLIAVGNPSHEFFLPSDAVIPGKSSITLLSSTCDDTLLWAQIKLSAIDIDINSTSDMDVLNGSTDVKMPRSEKKNDRKKAKHSSVASIRDSEGVTDKHIAVVAGLSALSKGDILCLHLIDRLGRNICMVQGTEVDITHTKDTTVFGDNANDNDKNSYLSSLTNIAKDSKNSCSIQ